MKAEGITEKKAARIASHLVAAGAGRSAAHYNRNHHPALANQQTRDACYQIAQAQLLRNRERQRRLAERAKLQAEIERLNEEIDLLNDELNYYENTIFP